MPDIEQGADAGEGSEVRPGRVPG